MFKDDSLAFKMFTSCLAELSIKSSSLFQGINETKKKSENETMYS